MPFNRNDAIEVRHSSGWIAARIECEGSRVGYDVVLEDGERLLNVPEHALRAAAVAVAETRAIAVRLALMPTEMVAQLEPRDLPVFGNLVCEAPTCGETFSSSVSPIRVERFRVTHGGPVEPFVLLVTLDRWTIADDGGSEIVLCPKHSLAAHRAWWTWRPGAGSHIEVSQPNIPMRGSAAVFAFAEPGSDAFRRTVELAKQYGWPDDCPHCGRPLRSHDPELCMPPWLST